MWGQARAPGTSAAVVRLRLHSFHDEVDMGRAAILWLVGVPIPVLLLMWVFGWLH